MGNIRTKDIKNAAFQIKGVHREKLGKDFEANKQVIKELKIIDDKKMRNKVTGYLTRIMRNGKD